MNAVNIPIEIDSHSNSKWVAQSPTSQIISGCRNQVTSLVQVSMNLLSLEDSKFIETLIQEWLIHRLVEISAYHVSPTYNRESIQKNGLNNHTALLTNEQKWLFIELIKRLPPLERTVYQDRMRLIFWDTDDIKRWIYVSFDDSLENCYPVPESVRLYFCDMNEYFELLEPHEQELVINWFGDFHKKFSMWKDIWMIKASENYEILSIVLPIVKGYHNYFLADLKERKISWIGYDVHIQQGVSPNGIYLWKTEQSNPIDMWTHRCEKLINRLW